MNVGRGSRIGADVKIGAGVDVEVNVSVGGVTVSDGNGLDVGRTLEIVVGEMG